MSKRAARLRHDRGALCGLYDGPNTAGPNLVHMLEALSAE